MQTRQHLWMVWMVAIALVCSTACEPLSARDEIDAATDTAVEDTAGDVAGDTDDDASDDVVVGQGVEVMYDLAAARSGEAFYDFPFPSDLRVDADGTPDMTGFPAAGNQLIEVGIDAVDNGNVGFTPHGAIYFRFDGELDASSLPAGPGDAMSDETAVAQIIDIDPDSPTFGARLPAYVTFHPSRSQYWRQNMLAVRTVPGIGMRNGTRYATILTSKLRAADGGPVRSEVFEALLRGEGDAELVEHYAGVMSQLEAAGVDPAEVVAATAFTTSDVALQMDALREAIHAHEGFAVTDWEKTADGTWVARFETLEFFGSGEPPYDTAGEGAFEFDAEGKPIGGQVRSVRLAISVPVDQAMPAGGYPLVIYGHGTGGDFDTHIGGNGEGAFLAREGIATLGFDAALHGDRVETPIDVETLIASNPIAAREVVRQTVVDTLVVYRLLAEGALDIPAAVTGGEAITFDASHGLYMGHSQGAQEAALLLGVEPDLEAAFLSAGGASINISVRERAFNGTPIACTLSLFIGISDCAELTAEHPVMTLVVQPLFDGADPLNYAHRFIKEPLPGHPVRHVVMSQGTLDAHTPPAAQHALAAAIGLPLIEPVASITDPLELLAPPRLQPPVALNIETEQGAVTGGLLQWAGEDHFAIYDNVKARNQYIEFFKSAVAGTPTVVGAN